uniref:EOG090X0HIV n=1 Tax=Lynceus sp. MCZ IZ 141354 TaxID=1930659 RepID=A0A9N6ZG45_9CRUS|nr:EOG090X0HIV [Lynceus sp. MCZ IZ 141354]
MSASMSDKRLASLIGNFSFEGDSLPEFSEFDTTSQVLAYKNERNPVEGKMAPMTVIETITITRPLKVISFLCGALALALLVMSLASTDWLLAQGWRQGLFFHCVDDIAERPLPFGLQEESGCYRARDEGYIRATAALCVVGLAADIFATLLTGLGLQSGDSNKKYRYYRLAVYVMLFSLFAILIGLVLYPICFSRELAQGNRSVWEFGWAYGVAWGAAIFLFGACVLLMCDKEAEELYYKERNLQFVSEKS